MSRQKFRVPVHPLAFSTTMACALFERDGWQHVGFEASEDGFLSYALFERDIPPKAESYFDLGHLYLGVPAQQKFCSLVYELFGLKSNDGSIAELLAKSYQQSGSPADITIAERFEKLDKKRLREQED